MDNEIIRIHLDQKTEVVFDFTAYSNAQVLIAIDPKLFDLDMGVGMEVRPGLQMGSGHNDLKSPVRQPVGHGRSRLGDTVRIRRKRKGENQYLFQLPALSGFAGQMTKLGSGRISKSLQVSNPPYDKGKNRQE